ncbi:MAG: type II toxin-antitoxin system mRNA interferase toxin, RelE/StbE family [Gemmatimonadota bacterium]
MPPRFQVHVTSRFRRDAQRLLKQHPELTDLLEQLRDVLQADPHCRSREHDIHKLTGIGQGEGQWRLRVGDYRLRYDIIGHDVVLYSFRHRREVY